MFKIEDTNIDKRVLRTRKLLCQAFFELMQEKEFQQVTVQDITERATINRATFYAHFPDKYALCDYAVRSHFQEHLEKEMPHADTLTWDNLRMLSLSTLTFLHHFIGQCAPSKRQDNLSFESQISQHLSAVILDWLDTDSSRMSLDVSSELMATTTSASIMGAALFYARKGSTLSPDEYIDQLMTLMSQGVLSMAYDM